MVFLTVKKVNGLGRTSTTLWKYNPTSWAFFFLFTSIGR